VPSGDTYLSLDGAPFRWDSTTTTDPVPEKVQEILSGAATLSLLQINVGSNPLTSTFTATLDLDQVPSTATIPVLTGQTGIFSDPVHTAAPLAGSGFALHLSHADGAHSLGLAVCGCIYTSTTQEAPMAACSAALVQHLGGPPGPNIVHAYEPIVPNGIAGGVTEAPWEYLETVAATLTKLTAYVDTFTLNATPIAHIQKAANGSTPIDGAVTWSANATGRFTDPIHSDLIAVGSVALIHYQDTSTAGQFRSPISQVISTSPNQAQILDLQSGIAAGARCYYPIRGAGNTRNTSQSAVQRSLPFTVVCQNLLFVVDAGLIPTVGNADVALDVNGSKSALALTVHPGDSGKLQDTVHLITVPQGGLFNLEVDQSAVAAGAIGLTMLGFDMLALTAAVPLVPGLTGAGLGLSSLRIGL
jgi:hypothetical protein